MSPPLQPITPQRQRSYREFLDKLNQEYELEIPAPQDWSPIARGSNKSVLLEISEGLRSLFWGHRPILDRILADFEEWIAGNQPRTKQQWNFVKWQFEQQPQALSKTDRDQRVDHLFLLIRSELYLLKNKPLVSNNRALKNPREASIGHSPKKRRISNGDDDEFHTAPNSPAKGHQPVTPDLRQLEISEQSERSFNQLGNRSQTPAPTFLERLRASETVPHNERRYDALRPAMDAVDTSFSIVTSSSLVASHSERLEESFATDITEPMDFQSTYADSVVDMFIEQEMSMNADMPAPDEQTNSMQEHLVTQLLQYGPFSVDQPLPARIALRSRYELERIAQAWNVPLDQMLKNSRVCTDHETFWKWVQHHSLRGDRPMPEKSPRRAWDAAVDDFKTGRHSEVVVLTGELDWCAKNEPGIFKLRLNPLKPERTCRFHRRFGSDRFLTVTIPAAARPPEHLRLNDQPSVLRQSIASWLTRNDHYCLGRTWRAFFVEEVKSKKKVKAEPRFRVEFFAVDGADFLRRSLASLAPPNQASERHTPMSLSDLLEWHMPSAANHNQKSCMLFQRISLGLSKIWTSVVVPPTRVINLLDVRRPGQPVMNDGCALVSRNLARRICEQLGINGDIPSAFQGRIAGAKGLWMVDSERSKHGAFSKDGGDGIWIEISDSQLKIKPHPVDWKGFVDEEKLTFEVVNWSKPLHPVDLNIQLLGILEFGGHVKEYVAKLTHDGVWALYHDFAHVLQTNDAVHCRNLLQKLRPSSEDGPTKARRMEQWNISDAEYIIRLTEAGFKPQSFRPLRRRLRKYLEYLLEQHVEELHIQVPLSTYAYCIADPYGVLQSDEVHFGLSTNWRDPNNEFLDNMVTGRDVLVGRLPAHVPSDIQRRKAVWKNELRHFKDVIVFPTTGDVPLAHMLSGGDYDGDTPWICWDPTIVEAFHNSDLPDGDCPPQQYGLTEHSVPMAQLPTTADFLQSVFEFNLTMSSLGKCTIEHEKVSYDESIDSPNAKELACLLSQLVDGRKGGVHLSELAWQKYRNKISPKKRLPPAYRLPLRKPKTSNIVDYLKFEIAMSERDAILKQLNDTFPEDEGLDDRDEDLIRPWQGAITAAGNSEPNNRDLSNALSKMEQCIKRIFDQWVNSFTNPNETETFSPKSREVISRLASFPPPEGSHWLICLWRNRPDEWQRLLGSYLYQHHPHSTLPFHAFGEALCQLKASSQSSRSIIHDVLVTYRVNQKMVARLTARETLAEPEAIEEDADEYEGAEAIESLISSQGLEAHDGFDDGISVE
ncbi:RNA-directed RNA polymerase [Penicillium atrosanguineum]|uniref:RNA-dependent RNA polymerase n=1 Tax=Penicillium atrosanguineum TaxID=1132637 RepID=A0A9W9U859_9EURO|nr:RNA-directed RNA polymerase [Penicillium atrosanguineum]